jgi:putative aldouronate transport system substrate-binding protein
MIERRTRGRVAGGVAAALALALALTGCGNGNADDTADKSDEFGFQPTGLPIVEKQLTLTIAGEKSSLAPDYNEMTLVQGWEEDTNITIDWEMLAPEVYSEKRNLLLASNDLPDAFLNSRFTDAELVKYGTNGTLIPLEDLIAEHAPNLTAIFEANPDLKAAVTASDGHIYALPNAEELGLGAVPFFWSINKSWLDALGLPVPTTVDEYHDALVAFKTQDPNGNGKADEIPLSFINNWWCADIGDLFAALGGIADNTDHRIVRDEEVIYTGADDRYRDAIQTLHEWYEEGLIDAEAFTQDDKAYLAKGKTETPVLGSYVWWETEEVVGTERAADYVLLPVLEGVNGRLVGHSNLTDYGRSAFAITRSNEYPSATMRWVDALYEPKMSAQVSYGPIGETLVENADGVLEQAQLPEGVNAGELRQKVALGAGAPHVITRSDYESVILPEPRALQRAKALEENYLPYIEPDFYPSVFFDVEELEQIGQIEPDIDALVEQKRAEWIVSGGIEDEWTGYVDQLRNMGLDDLLKIYQSGYDRYRAAAG